MRIRKRDKKLLLFLIEQGVPAKLIEKKLGISRNTVYYYRSKLEREKKRLYPPLAETLVEELFLG